MAALEREMALNRKDFAIFPLDIFDTHDFLISNAISGRNWEPNFQKHLHFLTLWPASTNEVPIIAIVSVKIRQIQNIFV